MKIIDIGTEFAIAETIKALTIISERNENDDIVEICFYKISIIETEFAENKIFEFVLTLIEKGRQIDGIIQSYCEIVMNLIRLEESISSIPDAFYGLACVFKKIKFTKKVFLYLEKDLEYRSMQSADAL